MIAMAENRIDRVLGIGTGEYGFISTKGELFRCEAGSHHSLAAKLCGGGEDESYIQLERSGWIRIASDGDNNYVYVCYHRPTPMQLDACYSHAISHHCEKLYSRLYERFFLDPVSSSDESFGV